jgi:hypothetical protein
MLPPGCKKWQLIFPNCLEKNQCSEKYKNLKIKIAFFVSTASSSFVSKFFMLNQKYPLFAEKLPKKTRGRLEIPK